MFYVNVLQKKKSKKKDFDIFYSKTSEITVFRLLIGWKFNK